MQHAARFGQIVGVCRFARNVQSRGVVRDRGADDVRR